MYYKFKHLTCKEELAEELEFPTKEEIDSQWFGPDYYWIYTKYYRDDEDPQLEAMTIKEFIKVAHHKINWYNEKLREAEDFLKNEYNLRTT